jgi:cytochrome b561
MPIRNTPERWGALAQLFHWTIVVLVIAQFILANIAEDLPAGMQKIALIARHKSIGMTILGLALLRLAWRVANPTPALPSTLKNWERVVARWTHGALYALLFIVPLLGWTMSSAKNYPVSWFGLFQFPDLVAPNESIFDFAHEAHELLAKTLGILAIVHLLAALALLIAAAPATPVSAADPGRWQGDNTTGTLTFDFTQAGATTKGAFGKFMVRLTTDAGGKPTALEVDVTIESVDTKDGERDRILMGSDLFDAKKYPLARYRATRFMEVAKDRYMAAGQLTIRDVTRDLALPFSLTAVTPGAAPGVILAGEQTIRRLDYGVGRGEWRSTEMVGNDVTLRYSVRLPASRD